MKTQFNLSEKRKDYRDSHQEPIEWLELKDVKEFIRLLKEELLEIRAFEVSDDLRMAQRKRVSIFRLEIKEIIDKLAGKDLK